MLPSLLQEVNGCSSNGDGRVVMNGTETHHEEGENGVTENGDETDGLYKV